MTPIQEGEDDEDITMLDTPEIWSSTSYKSSPTWSSHLRFGTIHHQSLRTNSVYRHHRPYLFVACLRLITFRSSIDYFSNSYDYFQFLQQLGCLLPTTSTTCMNTSDYFNNSYDYFLCDHDKVPCHLFLAKSVLYRVGP
jgi:hypothetical protein